MTGQMDRNEALERLKNHEMSEEFCNKKFKYVANKLEILRRI